MVRIERRINRNDLISKSKLLKHKKVDANQKLVRYTPWPILDIPITHLHHELKFRIEDKSLTM